MQYKADLIQEVQLLKQNQKVLEDEVRLLREQNNLLKVKLFGRQTEKMTALGQESLQQELFPMEEAESEEEGKEEGAAEDGGEKTPTVTYQRKKRGARRPIPEWFPRNEVIHDIPEGDRVCGCGEALEPIGQETSEQIDWIPARVEVTRHVRIKRACRACEGLETQGGTVKIVPVPPQMLPKSLAGPGLLAAVMVNKFADGLPFHRQEARFARAGLRIPRTTMATWAAKTARRCGELVEMLREELLQSPYLQIDETTLQVLKEEGRKNQTKSYTWVIRGAPPGPKIVFFHYQPTRQTAFLQEWLQDYKGYIQTDGYHGYDFLDAKEGVVHLGCWAHARRKFADIVKSFGKRKHPGRKTHAERALAFIVDLYKVEKEATALGLDEAGRLAKRQEASKPIAEDFKKWLEDLAPKALTGSMLGKAVGYTLGQWPRLVAYLETGFCALDTNGVENAIRPFVVGRKAWLFSGSPAGAAASAAMFTLTQTAKACGWEPYAYFRFLFDHLPLATTREEMRRLLPTIAKPTA